MNRIVAISRNIKFVGLLGLPGLFFDSPLFDLLWLFWLFGLVEIFSNLPVFVQSLKQAAGMVVVPLRYGSRLPNQNDYHCKIKYSLPFEGNWIAVNGSVDKKFSHSWGIPTQRYAYDFLILDHEGKSGSGNKEAASDYYCYGKEITAPADGQIAEIGNSCPDSRILGGGKADCSARDIRGNYILIRHTEKEYSLLAHLQPGSIAVKEGQHVNRKEFLARCGNSGNSSEPHLHFQLQEGRSFFNSAGLPITFENITVCPASHYSDYDLRPVPPASDGPTHYISRGQNVANS